MSDTRRSLRCLKLLATLVDRGVVDRQDAAQEFGVVPRVISSDMELVAQVAPLLKSNEGRRRQWVLQPWLHGKKLGVLERICLLLGRDMASFLAGTPFHEGTKAHAEIEAGFSPTYSRNLARKFRYQPEPYRRYQGRNDDHDVLIDSLLREYEISFDHLKGEVWTRYEAIQPLTLVTYRRALYLVCRKPDGAIRRFAVDRMRTISLGHTFDYPSGWDPDEHLQGTFGIFSGGEPEEVVLRFSPGVAPYVNCRSWHDSQRLVSLPSGGVELHMKTSGPELVRFALEWGASCEVLKPTWLREKVVEELEGALRTYNKNPRQHQQPRQHLAADESSL